MRRKKGQAFEDYPVCRKQRMKRYNRVRSRGEAAAFRGVYGKAYTHFQKLLKLYGSLAELIVMIVNDPGIFTEAASISYRLREGRDGGDGGFGTLEDVPHLTKGQRVTIDWKEGRVKFLADRGKLLKCGEQTGLMRRPAHLYEYSHAHKNL